jgi:hypothetical protein
VCGLIRDNEKGRRDSDPSGLGGCLDVVGDLRESLPAAAPALAYMACTAAEPFCHIEPRRDDEPAEPVIVSKERTEMDITVRKETTCEVEPQTN